MGTFDLVSYIQRLGFYSGKSWKIWVNERSDLFAFKRNEFAIEYQDRIGQFENAESPVIETVDDAVINRRDFM